MNFPARVRIGADGWNWDDWVGTLYPEGTEKSSYLVEYAKHYSAVEVDSTFYRIPAQSTVRKWFDQTPDDFVFAVKVPRGVTHNAFRGDYRERLDYFVNIMKSLEWKLGPLLFQFPYYNQAQFQSVTEFIEKLGPLLSRLPQDIRFSVEVRNKEWVNEELMEFLRRNGAAFVLVDHPWAERADTLLKRIDVVTADFCYVRWLGHQTKAEKLTDRWDHLVVDKSQATSRWVKILEDLLSRDVGAVYGFYRNRYAGYAPGSIELLKELWQKEAPH